MWSQREVVDFSLQRRRTLASMRQRSNTLSRAEVCDADPMLVRSALHHGEPAEAPCPVCASSTLQVLHYVFGTQLGQYSGRIKATVELEPMAHEFGEFKVCQVEVCTECGWNFMTSTWLMGDGKKRRPPRRQKTVEDIYG